MTKSSESKHTPTPPECIGMPMSTNPTGKLVTLSEDVYKALKGKKPAFIIRAVNSHEELLVAAKKAQTLISSLHSCATFRSDILPFLERAIAKAEGE